MTEEEIKHVVSDILLEYKAMYHEYLNEHGLRDAEAYRGGFYAQMLKHIAEIEELYPPLKLALLVAMVRIMTGAIDYVNENITEETQQKLRSIIDTEA